MALPARANVFRGQMKTSRLRGQTEAVSVVLISGIVVSLVAGAYMWGVPLIEKRTAAAEFSSMKILMREVDSRITALANAGGGRSELDISMPMELVPAGADGPNNHISAKAFVNQPIIYPGAEDGGIYLGASSFEDMVDGPGTFGQARPGVIKVSQENTELDSFMLTSTLRYRALETRAPRKSYLIRLCPENDLGDCNDVIRGSSRLTLTFKGTETIPGTTPDSGQVITTIGVRLS